MLKTTGFDLSALFAERAKRLPPEGAYPVTTGNIIRFGGGIPDPETYPVQLLSRLFDRILSEPSAAAWNYGGTAGFEGLRGAIAERLNARDGVQIEPSQIMVTNGISQGLATVAHAFVDPGDTIIVEETSFPLSLSTLRIHDAKLVPAPMDRDGIRMDALESTLARLAGEGIRPKFLYTISNFQNPEGSCLPDSRRRAIVDLSERYGFLVVQDDAYGDIRFTPRSPASFVSLAPERSIQLGTFSKTIAPGLRTGWTVASPEISRVLIALRTDMGTSPIIQRVLAAFLDSGEFAPHVERANALYREKLNVVAEGLEKFCANWVTWNQPAGGFFLWVGLKRGDAADLARHCATEEVAVNPGRMFFAGEPQPGYFRMSYSYLSKADLWEGTRRLGKALAKYDATLPR